MHHCENQRCGRLFPEGCNGLEKCATDDPKCESYRGCQTTTVSGRTCQKWSSQSPHEHLTTPDLGQGLGDHNFCRNPIGFATIWCLTTDPTKRWEICAPIGSDAVELYDMRAATETPKPTPKPTPAPPPPEPTVAPMDAGAVVVPRERKPELAPSQNDILLPTIGVLAGTFVVFCCCTVLCITGLPDHTTLENWSKRKAVYSLPQHSIAPSPNTSAVKYGPSASPTSTKLQKSTSKLGKPPPFPTEAPGMPEGGFQASGKLVIKPPTVVSAVAAGTPRGKEQRKGSFSSIEESKPRVSQVGKPPAGKAGKPPAGPSVSRSSSASLQAMPKVQLAPSSFPTWPSPAGTPRDMV